MENFGRNGRKDLGANLGHDPEIPVRYTWANTSISGPQNSCFPEQNNFTTIIRNRFKSERSRTELPEAVTRAHVPTIHRASPPLFKDCGDFPSIDKLSCRPHGETASGEFIFCRQQLSNSRGE
jgi:hypothetical protein